MHLSVEVISDVICPWCYIGKRRLEKAIADFQGRQETQVRWLPFQLNPTMPKEGISRKDYRSRKFGSWERSLELDAKVAAVGEPEGSRFAFDKIERTPNTVDAHRLICLADQNDCQDAVVEALFRAYFSEGLDIGNRQTLIDIVTEVGLDSHAVESMWNSGSGMESITEAAVLSQRHQVSSVPFFVINDGITLSGAQEPTMFLDAFNQAIKNSNDSRK
jgi:predicted DsbA family dithiol-disulfide isomerase